MKQNWLHSRKKEKTTSERPILFEVSSELAERRAEYLRAQNADAFRSLIAEGKHEEALQLAQRMRTDCGNLFPDLKRNAGIYDQLRQVFREMADIAPDIEEIKELLRSV